jgi:chemotaxis response regulator CheB
MAKRRNGSTTDCCVAGIGASAGGITALQRFFQALPADPNLSLVVIQHRATGPAKALRKIAADERLARRAEDWKPPACTFRACLFGIENGHHKFL